MAIGDSLILTYLVPRVLHMYRLSTNTDRGHTGTTWPGPAHGHAMVRTIARRALASLLLPQLWCQSTVPSRFGVTILAFHRLSWWYALIGDS